MEETEQVSEDDELYEQDVRDIVYVLEKTKEKTKTQNDRQNFIRSSSNIVSENKLNVWENIPVRSHADILLVCRWFFWLVRERANHYAILRHASLRIYKVFSAK